MPALALILASACGVENSSASPAVDRLRRMLEAEGSLAYQGLRETEFGSSMYARRHSFVTKTCGAAAVVETVGEPAGRRRAWSEGSGRLAWLADPDLLLRNYRVETAGRERVADRPGIVLEVRALHSSRPGVRLVADEETGLLLAAEFRDYRGERTFSTRFRTLLLGPDLPVAERPVIPEGGRFRKGPPGSDAASALVPLRPRYLPEGFVPVRECCSARFAETLYSDGLGWISLTQTPADPGGEERVVRQRVDGSRVRMTLVLGGVSLRLVGRLHPAELFRILDSLGPGAGGCISTSGDPGGAHPGGERPGLVLLAGSDGSDGRWEDGVTE